MTSAMTGLAEAANTASMEATKEVRAVTSMGRFFALLQPAFLAGFTFPDWMRLLRRNRWHVDGRFIPRALFATLGSVGTTLLKAVEDSVEIRLDDADEAKWRRPVFILGLGRSGTTHLFHLLAKDPQFCFATRLDRNNPHTFLTLRKLGLHRLLGLLPARKRFMDNLQTGWLSPDEDDIAYNILTGSGRWIHWVFPRTGDYACSPEQLCGGKDQAFQAALAQFTRKLVFFHKRRVLLKSPSHTVAIPQLCEVFEEARFVTILRDPFSHFMSLAGMHRSNAMEWARLQRCVLISEEAMLKAVADNLGRYLETKSAIPAGRLIEIKYQDLVSDQKGTLAMIYEHLQLELPPVLREARRRDYQPNRHPDLTPELKERIRDVYRPYVDAGLFDPHDLL